MTRAPGSLHHIELWVGDLAAARESWGWLLPRLGYVRQDSWSVGESWSQHGLYLVLEAGPDVVDTPHERRRPGVNHLAFVAGSREVVDGLVAEAPQHGWSLMFADRHPYAGGPQHYAAYLEDSAGFEVELVAGDA